MGVFLIHTEVKAHHSGRRSKVGALGCPGGRWPLCPQGKAERFQEIPLSSPRTCGGGRGPRAGFQSLQFTLEMKVKIKKQLGNTGKGGKGGIRSEAVRGGAFFPAVS